RMPKEKLIEQIHARIEKLPGNIYEFTQPIQDRFNELIAGVTSDVAVRVFGDDLEQLRAVAERTAGVLRKIHGAEDVKVEQVSGLPLLRVDIDHAAESRYGLSVSDIQSTVRTALAGTEAGVVLQGDRRYEIVVRLPEHLRNDVGMLERLPITTAATATDSTGAPMHFVPLGAVSKIELTTGPNEIQRKDGKRLIVVQANVRGRDMGGFVAEAQREMAKSVTVPSGYWVSWGGQFENLIAARRRLTVVVPL